MSIFRPEVVKAMGILITEESLDALEDTLQKECRQLGIAYTRQYLKTIVATVRRFISLGISDRQVHHYNGEQVAYVVCVERLLARFEAKVIKFQDPSLE
jgi:predicted RNA binding protein with dsRBD fold (UPF0201 family)